MRSVTEPGPIDPHARLAALAEARGLTPPETFADFAALLDQPAVKPDGFAVLIDPVDVQSTRPTAIIRYGDCYYGLGWYATEDQAEEPVDLRTLVALTRAEVARRVETVRAYLARTEQALDLNGPEAGR